MSILRSLQIVNCTFERAEQLDSFGRAIVFETLGPDCIPFEYEDLGAVGNNEVILIDEINVVTKEIGVGTVVAIGHIIANTVL